MMHTSQDAKDKEINILQKGLLFWGGQTRVQLYSHDLHSGEILEMLLEGVCLYHAAGGEEHLGRHGANLEDED